MTEKGLPSIFPEDKSLVPPRTDVAPVLKNLTDSGGVLLKFSPGARREDIERVAGLVVNYNSGKEIVPTPGDFLSAANTTARHELAQRRIKGILSLLVLKDGKVQESSQGLKTKLTKEFNDLSMYLGHIEANKIIKEELANLPDLERALLYKKMSTFLKADLGYVDIEECDEKQVADYLLSLASAGGFGKTREKEAEWPARSSVIEDIASIMSIILEREEKGEISPSKVVDYICEKDYSDKIFERLLQVADAGNFIDLLEAFFQSHGESRDWARACGKRLKAISPEDYYK